MFADEQNYVIYIALESPQKDIYDQKFLADADKIFSEMIDLPGVDSVISAMSMQQIRRAGLGIRKRAYLEYESLKAIEKSRERNQEDSTLLGTFITDDLKHICAYVIIDPDIFDKKERDVFADELDAHLSEFEYKYVISGVPYIRTGYVRKLKSELIVFISLSTFLILSVLFFTYRNFWGVLIPVVTVNAALIWILGFYGDYWSNCKFNYGIACAYYVCGGNVRYYSPQ